MNRYRRIKYAVLILGTAFIMTVLGYIILNNIRSETRNVLDEEITQQESALSADIVIKPFIRENIQGKDVKYSINAEEGRLYSEYGPSGSVTSQRIEIDRIREIKIFSRDGRPVIISADRATVYNTMNQTEKILLVGNIRIQHPSMGTLKTSAMDFTFKDSIIRTAEDFVIEKGESLITGTGLTYDTLTNDVHVIDNLRASLYHDLKDEEPSVLQIMGITMVYNEADRQLIMDERTVFMFEDSWLKADRTDIYLDSDMNLEMIALSSKVSGELPSVNEDGQPDTYRLSAKEMDIFFARGAMDKISLNQYFMLERTGDEMFISGRNALIEFEESDQSIRAQYVRFFNGFYFEYQNSGFTANSGILDIAPGLMSSEDMPILYNYPYITKAQSIILDNNRKILKARNNIHTIIPEYGRNSRDFERMDIHATELDYNMSDETAWYKNNCKIDSDTLTIHSDDIKLYNRTQLAQLNGNVSGELTKTALDGSGGDVLYFKTEYMHYDAKGDAVLLKEVSSKYPEVWQKGFRASSKSIIIKPGEDYVFFSEDAETIFFREFYEKNGNDGGFFSFDKSDMPVMVSAESLEIFHAEKTIKYSGDVYARKGENNLATDIMTIYLNHDNEIDRAECTGSLKIGGEGRYVEGDRGTYYKEKDEFHIEQNVSFYDKLTSLQNAQKLVYYLRENRYAVYGTEIITKYRFEEPYEVPKIFPKKKGNLLNENR